MRMAWADLETPKARQCDGQTVELIGFPVAGDGETRSRHFLLTAEAPCCPGCAPSAITASVEVLSADPLPMRAGVLRLSGIWHSGPEAFRLTQARAIEPPGWKAATRRNVLTGGPLICLAACAAATDPAANAERGKAAIEAGRSIDLHSHAGGIANVARITSGEGFSSVAVPMRAGGMAVACLAIVSDGPTHKVQPDGRIRPFRESGAGELYRYGTLAFERLHALLRREGLPVVSDRASLQAARAGAPAVIVSAEGADFLEGDIARVDEAYTRWSLRHLQLTHYRVNELGDIQTEPPVHGGLTDFGAEVIRRCNRLGIVVDIAHGTIELVRRAATVSTTPLILSHTSLASNPSRYSRRITVEHARIVAATGGVIGIWPPASEFPTLSSLAAGMARAVDAAGIDHVGLGSDIRGLTGLSVFPDYYQLPGLADALFGVGFAQPEVVKLLGGNYARVLEACLRY